MRAIPDPGYAGDDGSAGADVTDALRRVAGGAPPEVAVAALCRARVLVPVVALAAGTAAETAPGTASGGAAETASGGADMAAVLMTGRDGRRALLAFTGLAALRAWNPEARPVPVSTRDAAEAALTEGADALVVDVAGPVQVTLEGETLRGVARGQRLVPDAGGWAWAAPLR